MTRALAIALALPLAGCGSGPIGNSTMPFDTAFRDSFRPKFITQCQDGARKASGNSSKDFSVLCGCVADKLIATKNASQLMVGPSDDEAKGLAGECLREHPAS